MVVSIKRVVVTRETVVTIPGVSVRPIVFFACFYAYVWKVIEPHLIYHGYGITTVYPEFSTDWGFFREHLSYAAGPLEYAAGLLSHLFYSSWFGALIITAIAWLISAGTARLMTLSGTGESRFVRYVPALLMLMPFNQYDNSLYICLGVLAGVWVSILYEKICPKNSVGAIFVFILSLGVLYFIAGGGASIVFVLTAGIYVSLSGENRLIGRSNLLIGTLTIFLFGIHLSTKNPTEAFFSMMGFEEVTKWSWKSVSEICLYLFFPILAVVIGLRDNHSRHKADEKFGFKKTRFVLQIAALATVCFLTTFYPFDSGKKNRNRIIYLDRQEKWNEVVELISQLPLQEYSLFYNHFLNKALYFSGRFGEEMFFYPQQIESFLLSPEAGKGLKEFVGCHTFLQIGQVNLAEKKAHEVMENSGEHPQILKLFALINIVKNQPETARMYLKALSRKLFYGGQARELLARLDDDPHQNTDPEIVHLRSVMLRRDSHLSDNKTEELLLELLDENASNRMAFEYLMGYYLISGKLEEFAAKIPRLKELGFNNIPTHYAEGILSYRSIMEKKINMRGLSIRPEIVKEFKVFEKAHDDYKDNQTAAKVLYDRFGNCYYYYYIFYGTDLVP